MFRFIQQKRILHIVGFLTLLLSLAVSTQPAYACTPTMVPLTPGPTLTAFTLQSHVDHSTFVFEGTVTDGVRRDNDYVYIATIAVDRYFKGSGPQSVIVLGLGSGGDCAPTGDTGMHGIFYTYLDDQDQQLHIIPSSYLEPADLEVVATLASIASQVPTPSAGTPAPQVVPQSSNAMFTGKAFLLLLCVGVITFVLVIAVILWFARRKKPL